MLQPLTVQQFLLLYMAKGASSTCILEKGNFTKPLPQYHKKPRISCCVKMELKIILTEAMSCHQDHFPSHKELKRAAEFHYTVL